MDKISMQGAQCEKRLRYFPVNRLDMVSPFNVLGISEDASEDEIKEAYRERLRETHPDKGGSVTDFKLVKSAYQEITSSKKSMTGTGGKSSQATNRSQSSSNTSSASNREPPRCSKCNTVINDLSTAVTNESTNEIFCSDCWVETNCRSCGKSLTLSVDQFLELDGNPICSSCSRTLSQNTEGSTNKSNWHANSTISKLYSGISNVISGFMTSTKTLIIGLLALIWIPATILFGGFFFAGLFTVLMSSIGISISGISTLLSVFIMGIIVYMFWYLNKIERNSNKIFHRTIVALAIIGGITNAFAGMMLAGGASTMILAGGIVISKLRHREGGQISETVTGILSIAVLGAFYVLIRIGDELVGVSGSIARAFDESLLLKISIDEFFEIPIEAGFSLQDITIVIVILLVAVVLYNRVN